MVCAAEKSRCIMDPWKIDLDFLDLDLLLCCSWFCFLVYLFDLMYRLVFMQCYIVDKFCSVLFFG